MAGPIVQRDKERNMKTCTIVTHASTQRYAGVFENLDAAINEFKRRFGDVAVDKSLHNHARIVINFDRRAFDLWVTPMNSLELGN